MRCYIHASFRAEHLTSRCLSFLDNMKILVERVNEEESKKRAEEIVKEAVATNLASVTENFKVLTTKDQPGTTEVHKEEQGVSPGLAELQQPLPSQV